MTAPAAATYDLVSSNKLSPNAHSWSSTWIYCLAYNDNRFWNISCIYLSFTMLIIHNMYFPHGYQYTYIYFREGVKSVDWKIFHKSLWMAVGVLQGQIGICLNPNDFICHMPIRTCRTPHRLSLNSFCKKYTNISVHTYMFFFLNSPQMGPSSKAKAQMHSKKQKPRSLEV